MTAPVADYGDPTRETVYVDGYGRSYIQSLTVATRGPNFCFLFDPAKKPGIPFSLGLYLDRGLWLHGSMCRYPRERRVFVLEESPNEPHFQLLPKHETWAQAIFTHSKPLLDRGLPYRRLDYGTGWINQGHPLKNVEKSKLVSFCGSLQHPSDHGYVLRKDVAQRLLESGRAECFGRGIREIPDKTEAIAPFAFSVCMENTRADYYYTEKLIDCFLAETVPIYWGCPSIDSIFNPAGMLTFQSWDDLDRLLNELSMERYRAMREAVLENQRRVIDRKLRDYKDHYEKLAHGLLDAFPQWNPVPPWKRGRLAAACRFVAGGFRRPAITR